MQDLHKDKLGALQQDNLAMQALKLLFSEEIEKQKPVIGDDDDAKLGQKYRAYTQAKDLLNKIFIKMKDFNVSQDKKSRFNKEC